MKVKVEHVLIWINCKNSTFPTAFQTKEELQGIVQKWLDGQFSTKREALDNVKSFQELKDAALEKYKKDQKVFKYGKKFLIRPSSKESMDFVKDAKELKIPVSQLAYQYGIHDYTSNKCFTMLDTTADIVRDLYQKKIEDEMKKMMEFNAISS